MIAVPEPTGLKPGECSECKAQVPPKVGYCAPARCYCRHPECPAFARTFNGADPGEGVEPIALDNLDETLTERRAAAARIPDEIRATLKARREAKAAVR